MKPICLDLYIPRILAKISVESITETFNSLAIGRVFYIDTRNRINEKGNAYYFAFISIELFENDSADLFYYLLNRWGKTKVLYDNSNILKYWEIQKYIQKEKRSPLILPPKKTVTFTEKDRRDMEKEYDELQREIFNLGGNQGFLYSA